MKAFDTNVLVYAHRADMPFHGVARSLVKAQAESGDAWAIPWPCIHEFYSIVTNPKIFKRSASTPDQAIAQIEAWLASPSLELLAEPDDYAVVLLRLLAASRARGPLVHDARIVALCQARGVTTLVSADRDFSRIPGAVRIENPFSAA